MHVLQATVAKRGGREIPNLLVVSMTHLALILSIFGAFLLHSIGNLLASVVALLLASFMKISRELGAVTRLHSSWSPVKMRNFAKF